jgi:mono/diheme cytochrome c family protein
MLRALIVEFPPMRTAILSISWCLLGWIAAGAADTKAPPVTPTQAEFFESRIRPILAEHCWSCHGAKKQKSGLRLDSREAILAGSDSGPVAKPGDPANSPLIEAIRYQGETKMPPDGKKLKPREIEALTAWVKIGLPWPKAVGADPAAGPAWKKHWAFQPVTRPTIPRVKDGRWPATAVDRFILARLEQRALTPSAGADRRTLIRRVTFDLIGLPPTPEEVAAFEADRSPAAFARVVDRLLASPHYGERWGRYWLDVARYADTKGYVFFQESTFPWAYTYRDYVIRALNDDLPYDNFLLQQLVADQLPLGEDRRPLTALGFLTLGGRFMNNAQDILDDRIDVVTRGLLGLTVTCARCHDHKFDPIPTRDYYSLYGVFASCDEPTVPPLFEAPPRTPAYEAFARELRAREQKLTSFVKAKHDELVKLAKTRAAEYMLAANAARGQPTTADFMLIADGSDLNPKMLLRWQVYLERSRKTHHPVLAPWHAFASLAEKDFAAQAKLVQARLFGRLDPARPLNPLVTKAFAGPPPVTLADVAARYSKLLNDVDKSWLEQEATNQKSKIENRKSRLADPAQEEVRQVFYGANSPPNVTMLANGDLDLLPDRASQAKLQELRKAVETWRASGAAAPPRAMVLEDLPTPYAPRVFLRGNPNNLGPAVPRRFLSVLAGDKSRPFEHGSGRLDLAQAIVDPKNPLTARVMVNRIWLHHFGTGLVRTPADFGLRSLPPTHPELLDYLATYFMDNGWSIKKLHRLIVLSAVYQQQSNDRSDCKRLDPENLLLWKRNRVRLDFEATRDALLAVAGRLNRTVGGPSVPNITAPTATRRTLYGFLDRLNVPELMRTFDFPSPDATSSQRDSTTVAPQALFLMNNPFVIECARALVRRPEIDAVKDSTGRIACLYRLPFGREPNGDELRLAREYLGSTNAAPARWEQYAQALLLANEMVFID